MLHNSIKSNRTLEQLQWKLHESEDFHEWDGLTELFIELVDADPSLLEGVYIMKWYIISKNVYQLESVKP